MSLYIYCLVYYSIGGYGSGFSMPRQKGEDDIEYLKEGGGVHDIHGVWFKGHKSNSSKNRELSRLFEVV